MSSYLAFACLLAVLVLGGMVTAMTVILRRRHKRNSPGSAYRRGERPIWPARRK